MTCGTTGEEDHQTIDTRKGDIQEVEEKAAPGASLCSSHKAKEEEVVGFIDMQDKAGTHVIKLQEAQKQNQQAEAAAGLKQGAHWRYFEREFLARERTDADKNSMEAEGKRRWKAQGVREFMQRMEVWFTTKTSMRVDREDIEQLKTLAEDQQSPKGGTRD